VDLIGADFSNLYGLSPSGLLPFYAEGLLIGSDASDTVTSTKLAVTGRYESGSLFLHGQSVIVPPFGAHTGIAGAFNVSGSLLRLGVTGVGGQTILWAGHLHLYSGSFTG